MTFRRMFLTQVGQTGGCGAAYVNAVTDCSLSPLQKPEGTIYMAGDHVTHLVGRQAPGLSAHRALFMIDQAFGGKPAQTAMIPSPV
jgi:hypothetical protein